MLFFPRLGCPSFGLCFCFPKLGCPSFGFCYFAKTWLSKFWFMLFFQRLGCPSFGLRFSFAKTWLSKFWFQLCQATWSERGKHRTAPNSMTHQHHSTNDDWQHLTPSFNIIYNTHQQQNQPQILNATLQKRSVLLHWMNEI